MTQNDPDKIENSAGYVQKEQQCAKRRGCFWLLLLIILLSILFGWHHYKNANVSINPNNNQQNVDASLKTSHNASEPSSETAKNDNAAADLNRSSTSDQITDSDKTSKEEQSETSNSDPSSESATGSAPAASEDAGIQDDAATANDNTNSTSLASTEAGQSASAKDSVAAPTVITTESQAALAKLDTYFKNAGAEDSDWIDLDDVSFAVGSAVPQFNAEKFKRIAEALASHSENHFLIHGFTDSTGPNELNNQLSTERADEISKFFLANGVKPAQISVEGQGAKSAVADNDTKDGRDKNRRVAIKVLAAK